MPRSATTAARPPRRESKKARLKLLIEAAPRDRIDEPRFQDLRAQLQPISEEYLRKLLRESGVPLAPLVEGVSLSSFDALEHTLLALSDCYASGAGQARQLVIRAKDRLRWSEARARDEHQRAEKREMLLWVLTWLGNPPAFPLWLRLRKRAAGTPD
jgi:hypothetical protein